jgi:hypothetical protein
MTPLGVGVTARSKQPLEGHDETGIYYTIGPSNRTRSGDTEFGIRIISTSSRLVPGLPN